MLHLALAKVDVDSKGGPVFWGKEWFWSDVGLKYKQGQLYALSCDVAQHFLPLKSYQVSPGSSIPWLVYSRHFSIDQ